MSNSTPCPCPCPGAIGDPSGPSLELCSKHAPRVYGMGSVAARGLRPLARTVAEREAIDRLDAVLGTEGDVRTAIELAELAGDDDYADTLRVMIGEPRRRPLVPIALSQETADRLHRGELGRLD